MLTALLTGSPERTSELAGHLGSERGDVIVAHSRDGIAALPVRVEERSVGLYVQLSMGTTIGWSWAPAVTHRIEAIAVVAPLLARDAAVLIVADDPADPARDQRVADGLCLLAEGALATRPGSGVTISVAEHAYPDLITRALQGNSPEGWQAAPLAEIGADRDYADWRSDIYNLTSTSNVTYFGWLNAEDEPRVGLLRGSVVSPLAVPPDWSMSWGDDNPGARVLGTALLAQAAGGRAVDAGLVELFVKDVIAPLPATAFELSASEVEAWLRRHRSETDRSGM
jgi:hypothetical protein